MDNKTPWFPTSTPPVRTGVYEVCIPQFSIEYPDIILFRYFDGVYWRAGDTYLENLNNFDYKNAARISNMRFVWRGLTRSSLSLSETVAGIREKWRTIK